MNSKNNNAEKKKVERVFDGVAVSDSLNKTVVVKVDRTKIHPKYKKRYTVSRKYKVHDEENASKAGDKVRFVEVRPISKHKRWKIVK